MKRQTYLGALIVLAIIFMVFGYCITQLQEDVKDQQARLDELNTVLIQHANAITGSNFYLSKVIEYIGIENLDIEGGLDE